MNILNIITPVNIAEEKKKFFSDSAYHPVFEYQWNDAHYFKEVQDHTEHAAHEKDPKTNLIRAIIDQDLQNTQRYAQLYFDIENWDDYPAAKRIIDSPPTSVIQSTLKDFVHGFEKAFRTLGLKEYRVIVRDEAGFNFRPRTRQKQLIMSKHADFQFFDVEGEVRHELVHIIRYENGVFNAIPKSPDSLPTEEGLATLLQDRAANGALSAFQHAAEYVASTIGMKGSLRDIYDFFVSIGFRAELAWQRASRHKFGFVETQHPGDILKPAMYFHHSQKLQSFSNDELLRLFVGKISVAELPRYQTYTGSIQEKKLRILFELV